MKKFSPPIFFVLSVALLFNSVPVFADANTFIDKQKTFVKRLLESENYYECISETERLLKYGNFSTREKSEYNYLISSCYFMGGQYRTSVYRITKYGNPDDFKTGILLARSYFKLGLQDESRKAIMNVRKETLTEKQTDHLLLYKIYDYLYSGEYQAALSLIEKEVPDNVCRLPKNELISELIKYRDIPYRSPVIAGVLSAVVPGAGQAWSGRYADALICLAGVAVTAAASVFFYRKGERGLCVTFGVFSGLFYGGNIYSACNAAKAFNRKKDNCFRENYSRRFIPQYQPLNYIDSRGLFR